MTEFEIIERYFKFTEKPNSVVVGVGDDAAVLAPSNSELAITVDTLVSGVHFPVNTSPEDIGYKALAVNLSDLASMAAKPNWFTLSLVLPEPDQCWLEGFSTGLAELARQYEIALIGGDTTNGPLSISIQAIGQVAKTGAILRSGAHLGDDIYVSGSLGDAALGLRIHQNQIDLGEAHNKYCLSRLNRPTARVELGLALQTIATAMIDCSDGFAADLGHILKSSEVGAQVKFDSFLFSPAVAAWLNTDGSPATALTGGDDYELIFTAENSVREQLEKLSNQLDLAITRVGKIVPKAGLVVIDSDGRGISLGTPGYNHFNPLQ